MSSLMVLVELVVLVVLVTLALVAVLVVAAMAMSTVMIVAVALVVLVVGTSRAKTSYATEVLMQVAAALVAEAELVAAELVVRPAAQPAFVVLSVLHAFHGALGMLKSMLLAGMSAIVVLAEVAADLFSARHLLTWAGAAGHTKCRLFVKA